MTILATLSGAAMGATLDLATAGASHFMGSIIGGVLGFSAITFGGESLVETKVLMVSLGDKILEVGPAKNPNLGFVLLSRARLHHVLIAERSYADRKSIEMKDAFKTLISEPEFNTKRSLDKIFKKLRDEKANEEDSAELKEIVEDLLKKDLYTSSV